MSDVTSYHERTLLEQIAAGSETAFRQLFATYSPKLYNYLYRLTESHEAAEDATQDIFLKLWTNREKITAIDNVNAYLHRMAHNRAHDGFRQLAKETLLLSELRKGDHSSPPVTPGQELISKEVRHYILSLVDQLTPQQRTVFLFSREAGLKQEEIAQRMGISVVTVKKHMVDALRFLRQEIRNNYGSQSIAIFIVFQLTLSSTQ